MSKKKNFSNSGGLPGNFAAQGDDDAKKHEYLERMDEMSEGEPSGDVMDIDKVLTGAGLRPDPETGLKELNDAQELTEDTRED